MNINIIGTGYSMNTNYNKIKIILNTSINCPKFTCQINSRLSAFNSRYLMSFHKLWYFSNFVYNIYFLLYCWCRNHNNLLILIIFSFTTIVFIVIKLLTFNDLPNIVIVITVYRVLKLKLNGMSFNWYFNLKLIHI